MNKVIVFMSMSLDGVIQAPARPDEDTRGGFTRGGWALPYYDPVLGQAAAESRPGSALLLGRRTYQDFYSVWPERTDNPFTEVLNKTHKYVASHTLHEPLPWRNSTLLKGDVPAAVAALKDTGGQDLVILGSGALVQSLMPHGLIDEYELSIHPLVLGQGRRLFPEGSPYAALELVSSQISTTGVIIATYRPAKT
jgi:dihydrofolate reductase